MFSSSRATSRRVLRPSCCYFFFVAVWVTLATSLTVVVPLTAWFSIRRCDGIHCLSLERDMHRSVNAAVDPCQDFYKYVCSRWPKHSGERFTTPIQKYDKYLTDTVLKALVLESGQREGQQQTVREKVTALLVKCGGYTALENSMRAFLRSLKLPWPEKSDATRLDILDILAGSSLDYGIPAIWSFAVGRHPKSARENILYLTIDYKLLDWISHLDALQRAKNVKRYLRRCAELIGTSGQSYDRMITDVLFVHKAIRAAMMTHFGVYQPEYMNISDVELRIAVNRHLPDSSQLWPEDQILCLQRDSFDEFNQRYLSSPQAASQIKLYIGAYLVWYLSPFASSRLTEFLMEDMHTTSRTEDYVMHRCFDAVTGLLPLAVWKARVDQVLQKQEVFDELTHIRNAFDRLIRRYNETAADEVLRLMRSVSINAHNYSLSWSTLDKIYKFVPYLKGDFLHMYLSLARANGQVFKASIHNPFENVAYFPGVSSLSIYRLLIAREISVPTTLVMPPLFSTSLPPHVRMAVLGSHIAHKLSELLFTAYFKDADFHELSKEGIAKGPFPLQLYERYVNYSSDLSDLLNHTGILRGEQTYFTLRSLAMIIAQDQLVAAGYANSTAPVLGFPANRLFYITACFLNCRNPSAGLLEKIICNRIVPQVSGFADVFGCEQGQPMYIEMSKKIY